MKYGKRLKKAYETVDTTKVYDIEEAVKVIKENAKAKFDETVDIAVALGVDPRQSDQMVRGAVSLPAGTGKTYLAVVLALKALKNKQVERIILTRPAVEAGEKLGFLPGDLQDKVDPYLRPLYDGLYDVLGLDMAQKYMERQIIEIAPLAYMRGRTLDDAFIILDEAQNTTPEQMKMFLTRIGFGSKAVVTGDITQVDLPKHSQSGLLKAEAILSGIPEISFHHLTAQDVVRHPVVAKIIAAYDAMSNE